MSSAMVSAAAAQGRLFFSGDHAFPKMPLPPTRSWGEIPAPRLTDPRLAGLTSASRLGVRPAPEMLSSGIAAIHALTGGWPRGCLTEICGPASSGRTTVLLAALAAATRRGEFCVLVDASDALDPQSVADAGVELDRLLWVRCSESLPGKCKTPEKKWGRVDQNSEDSKKNAKQYPEEDRIESRSAKRQTEHRIEQVLHATDLLLESGGFGLVVLDLSDLPPQQARRIPLTTWFRFRRAIEHTPTVLLAAAQHPIAGSCSSLLLQLSPPKLESSESSREAAAEDSTTRQCRAGAKPTHAHLLSGLEITADLIHSRLERKPASSVTFASRTAWDTVASTQLPVVRKIAGY